jgi:hypothetical protein
MDKPAFPTWSAKDVVQGMTLRDYFAAAALSGLLSDPERDGSSKEYAYDAYHIADTMMEARDVA